MHSLTAAGDANKLSSLSLLMSLLLIGIDDPPHPVFVLVHLCIAEQVEAETKHCAAPAAGAAGFSFGQPSLAFTRHRSRTG